MFVNIITSLTNIVTVNNDTNVFINIIKDLTKLINIDCTCHKGKNLRKRHPELQKLLEKASSCDAISSQNIGITPTTQPIFQPNEQPDITQNTSFAPPQDTQTSFSSQPLPADTTVYIDATPIQSTSHQGFETGFTTQQTETQQKSIYRGISRPMKFVKSKIPNLDAETELRIQKLLLANLQNVGGYEYVSEDEDDEPSAKRSRC